MRVNESELNSSVLPRDSPAEGAPRRQPWVTSTLAAILIFTIAVDLLGNLLVILSVYRNKKLRNAALGSSHLAKENDKWIWVLSDCRTGPSLRSQEFCEDSSVSAQKNEQ
ncbi:melatonin receptor type 1A isoform X3 [Chamaea fasciata]|uniref:melatonin receptor type 1A isoform X3 n=1 Tax=Chamaea fasciata TaxID=190680 RepID=UPI00336A6E78